MIGRCPAMHSSRQQAKGLLKKDVRAHNTSTRPAWCWAPAQNLVPTTSKDRWSEGKQKLFAIQHWESDGAHRPHHWTWLTTHGSPTSHAPRRGSSWTPHKSCCHLRWAFHARSSPGARWGIASPTPHPLEAATPRQKPSWLGTAVGQEGTARRCLCQGWARRVAPKHRWTAPRPWRVPHRKLHQHQASVRPETSPEPVWSHGPHWEDDWAGWGLARLWPILPTDSMGRGRWEWCKTCPPKSPTAFAAASHGAGHPTLPPTSMPLAWGLDSSLEWVRARDMPWCRSGTWKLKNRVQLQGSGSKDNFEVPLLKFNPTIDSTRHPCGWSMSETSSLSACRYWSKAATNTSCSSTRQPFSSGAGRCFSGSR